MYANVTVNVKVDANANVNANAKVSTHLEHIWNTSGTHLEHIWNTSGTQKLEHDVFQLCSTVGTRLEQSGTRVPDVFQPWNTFGTRRVPNLEHVWNTSGTSGKRLEHTLH